MFNRDQLERIVVMVPKKTKDLLAMSCVKEGTTLSEKIRRLICGALKKENDYVKRGPKE